jgi:hypothetical protein
MNNDNCFTYKITDGEYLSTTSDVQTIYSHDDLIDYFGGVKSYTLIELALTDPIERDIRPREMLFFAKSKYHGKLFLTPREISSTKHWQDSVTACDRSVEKNY